jgi:TonB family protein
VVENGKLTEVEPDFCTLAPVPEYSPIFISVKNLKVTGSTTQINNATNDVNNRLRFAGDFSSPYQLTNVVFALELDTEKFGKAVAYHEVDDLTPGTIRSVYVDLHLPVELGNGHWKLHVFADGSEVLTSMQSFEYREGMMNQMVAKRIEGVMDAPPKPFFGPAPAYPAALRRAGVKGNAVVTIRITRYGSVTDPVVESATDPAFGQAAVDAVRQWRFLPKVVSGVSVETKASVPFVF